MHTSNHTVMLLIVATINIFLTKNILCDFPKRQIEIEYDVFGNIPVKEDLNKYIGALERILEFSSKNKHYVDLNFEFGLFLINAHIKPILKIKRTKLSVHTFHRLGKVLYETEKVMEYFHRMVEQMPYHLQLLHANVVKITTLYSNMTYWNQRMPALTLDLLKHTKRRTKDQLRTMYSKPHTYQKKVFSFNKGVPTPQISDKCMSFLADNEAYDGKRPPQCQLPDNCRKMLKESTDLGYFICHRLLLFIAAHLGRGCVVFTEKDDKKAMREMCIMISDESRYIAMNNYTIKDLLLEQVALCSLSGNAQFLQRPWLTEVLRFQSKLGCFGNEITSERYPKYIDGRQWSMAKPDNNILGGYCNIHLTAVAGAALAAAVRYILENYY